MRHRASTPAASPGEERQACERANARVDDPGYAIVAVRFANVRSRWMWHYIELRLCQRSDDCLDAGREIIEAGEPAGDAGMRVDPHPFHVVVELGSRQSADYG